MSDRERERTRGRLASIALGLALGALGAWTFWGLEVRHDITQFIPSSEDRELADVARQITGSELSRTLAIAVRGEDEAESIAAARELADRLRAIDEVAWVRSGPPAEVERAFYDLYFARRYAFFAETPEAARARLDDDALAEAARRLKREVTGPTAMLVRRVAQEDPLLAFLDHLRRLQGSAEGGPRVVDGQLVSEDGWGLVLLASEAPTFATERVGPMLDAIDTAMREVSAAHGGDVRFEQAGVHRFARRAETEIRADVERISTISSIGVVILFLALYRGPRFLLLGALPLAAGTIAATAACRAVFGSVHGITFAFGSSLLGVGIDFVAHYVNHHVLDPDRDGPVATMRKLWPGMALGAATTIAGLAGLGWTSFPGMREMALFAAVGVTVALVATRVMVPPWMPSGQHEAPRLARLAGDGSTWLWERIQARRGLFLGLPVVAMAIVGLGLPRLAWIDDIRALNQADPAWLAEDAAVRARVAQGEAGRLVIASGADDQEALARAEAAHRALAASRDAGEVAAFRSAHHFVRSIATQRDVDAAVRGAPELADRTVRALEAEGFVGSMFEPFRASLETAPPEPLTFDVLARSPIADLVRPFRVRLEGGRIAYLAFVDGVTDAAALRARLEPLEGVDYFDQREFLESAYRELRTRTTELLAVGLLVVLGMCVARYRSVRLGVASIAPALLASATALGILGLFGEPANLMHLVGALLVLSMAEDYAVFLIESRDDPRGVATTMVGIGVACVTTVLSFGLLAASSHPAMRALGLMASLGVALAFLLAPLSLLLAGDTSYPSNRAK